MASGIFYTRIREAIRVLRWSPSEQKTALLGTAFLALAGYFQQDLVTTPDVPEEVRWVLLGIGVVLLAWTAYRLWTSTLAPKQPDFEPGPVAIKGAAAFTGEDAELFSRLGRREELVQLRSWALDDQVPLVVVMGESGVGKTSLLRAGLPFVFGNGGDEAQVAVVYWEAMPLGAWDSLQRALSLQLPSSDSKRPAVVLIDQAEQLDPEQNEALFEHLREELEADPPYDITWLFAFRRDFLSDWMDFQLTLGERARQRSKTLSLKRFKTEKAKEIFSTLAEEAKLDIRDGLTDEILPAIAEGGTVSPVDLGITLQMLARNPDLAKDVAAFRSVGGHAALLTSYLESVLEPYSPGLREEVFRALLALVDVEEDRRLPEGKALEDLLAASRSGAPRHLELALGTLAQPGVRVVEVVGKDPRSYRLVHERFVPAIRRLTGKILDEADRVARLLERRYRAWEREGQARRFLLGGRDLRNFERQTGQIRWGERREEKRAFLRKSLRQRLAKRIGLVVAAMLLVAAGAVAWLQIQANTVRNEFAAWGLPEGIYDALPRLHSLDIRFEISKTSWLSRCRSLDRLSLSLNGFPGAQLPGIPTTLTNLSLDLSGSRIKSVGPLPPGLQELTLSLEGSAVNTLDDFPSRLSQLTIDLGGSGVRRLDHLPQGLRRLNLALYRPWRGGLEDLPAGLKDLALSLGSSPVATLEHLPEGLERLTLDLRKSQVSSLEHLPEGLRQLSLHLHQSEVASVEDLPSTLRELTLELGGQEVSGLGHLPSELEKLYLNGVFLEQGAVESLPKGLRDLTLGRSVLATFSVEDLPKELESLSLSWWWENSFMGLPRSLRQLSLSLALLNTQGLEGLPENLQQLTLRLSLWQGRSFEDLPRSLKELTVELDRSSLETLVGLPPNLKQLSLDYGVSPVTTLKGLPPGLFDLTLDLRSSPIQAPLEQLPRGLRRLSLLLGGSKVESLEFLPPNLEQLTLGLHRSRVRDLGGLPAGLKQLTIDLRGSEVRSLKGVPRSLECFALAIDQRSNLSLDSLPKNPVRIMLTTGRGLYGELPQVCP